MSDAEKASFEHAELPSQPRRAPPRPQANPAALGLFGFATTTLILSLYNLQARGVIVPNVIVGVSAFYGGLAQFLAGMWEFTTGNTFGASVFGSFGPFWMSLAAIYIPGTGIAAAYTDARMFENAIGLYLLGWTVLVFLFFIATLRTNVAFIVTFFILFFTFLFLAVGALTGVEAWNKAGGGTGVVTALLAYYIGLSIILGDDGIVKLPLGNIRK